VDETLLKLLLAVLVGGLIGAERELRVGIGLRTMMLICLGAALFTIFSDIFAVDQGDPRRIAAAVVTGVGFLGAGMIMRHQGAVIGLTTAATAWLVAALGMGIGMGKYLMIGTATFLVLLVLWAIPRFQQLTNARRTYTYEVLSPPGEEKYNELTAVMQQNSLTISEGIMAKEDGMMKYIWRAYGRPEDHMVAMLTFRDDQEISEFSVA